MDQTPLAGFEQDDYVKTGNFSAQPLAELLEEFTAVWQATIALVRSLDEAAWLRQGVANQKEISVRTQAFIIAGHERHHRVVLQERHFPGLLQT